MYVVNKNKNTTINYRTAYHYAIKLPYLRCHLLTYLCSNANLKFKSSIANHFQHQRSANTKHVDRNYSVLMYILKDSVHKIRRIRMKHLLQINET